MNRCLHITIQEGSDATPRRTTAYSSGRRGADPGEDHVIPRPYDPTDPEADKVMPKPDDPPRDPSDSGYGSYGGHGGRLSYREATATVSSASSCCGCGTPAGASPSIGGTTTPHPFIAPHDFSGFVIVRMAQGIDPNVGSLWELADRKDRPLPGLKAALKLPFKDKETKRKARAAKTPYLISKALVELKEGSGDESDDEACGRLLSRSDCIQRIRALEKATALTAFRPLHSLTAYWRLDLREHPDRVEEVVVALNRLAEVDLAYRELSGNDPQAMPGGQLFAEDQGYLGDAPMGISALWAWEKLAETAPNKSATVPDPHPLTVCDLEQGWNRDHQELKDLRDNQNRQLPILYGANQNDEDIPGHHGTAVLGQLAAAGKSPEGIKGVAADICQFVLSSHYISKDEREAGERHPFASTNGHVAAAIAQALESGPLGKGDILLLEIQRGLLPTEVDEADFDAIRLASGHGVIVVEAAGNGGFDLDAWSRPGARRSLQRDSSGDSGAILVGAARAGLPHDRVPLSNYGSRLDCFGWGENVTTCGFGDLAGTVDADLYTNSFNGTSSASPIIAGAAALLQALHTQQAGCRLERRAMRDLLSDPATGTRQGPNVPGHIGVMPDLKAIVNGLRLVPAVYMRRSVCDDGSTPGPDDEISSSPDILLWQGDITQATARYEEGKGRENLPAPGDSFVAGSTNQIYVRLRNRGLGKGKARVHLFASPAATLITPEHWIPWGFLDVDPTSSPPTGIIPQGDTLSVAGPVSPAFRLTNPDSGMPWSFLAVLSQPGEYSPSPYSNFVNWMAGLPPASPYFNWAQYRAFLRRHGVAWRNTHRVTPTGTTAVTPPFFIAGTPDRARRFDFEVIQRLPKGAIITLEVLTAFDAKLRQRQRWIDGTGPILPTILLPKRPGTAIREVELAAGTQAKATFTVTAPNTLNGSHSLAVRQLWRGEEVGRITWYFGLDN